MSGAAEAWARSVLPVVHITPVRSRPWASVSRVEAESGVWWLKTASERTAYEVPLMDLLARSGGPLVPRVICATTQPWMLVADGGAVARSGLDAVEPEVAVALWCEVLPRYAEIQRTVAVRDLIAVGVPDLSPVRLVEVFDTLTADGRWFTSEVAPEHVGQHARVLGARTELVRVAAQLAGGVSATVQHDDLHEGNVVIASDVRETRNVQVIDWGDAVIAHPFATLRVTLDGLARRLGEGSGTAWRHSPSLTTVVEAYLEPWRAGGESVRDLREQVDLGVRTADLGRAVGWARALGSPEAGLDLGYGDPTAGWLRRLADDLTQPRQPPAPG